MLVCWMMGCELYGKIACDLVCLDIAIDVDDVQFPTALFHVVGKVIHATDDDQMPGFDFVPEQNQRLCDLVVHVGFDTVDAGDSLGDLDGVELFLDRVFQCGVITAGGFNRATRGVSDDQQQR